MAKEFPQYKVQKELELEHKKEYGKILSKVLVDVLKKAKKELNTKQK